MMELTGIGLAGGKGITCLPAHSVGTEYGMVAGTGARSAVGSGATCCQDRFLNEAVFTWAVGICLAPRRVGLAQHAVEISGLLGGRHR